MKVLHITPHLGGGIGNVISGLCIRDGKNIHSILCLEEPENKHYYDICVENGIEVLNKNAIDIALKNVDIVQVEWWQHPLTVQFMVEYLEKINTRLIIWSHISGCNYPNIPASFVKLPDAFVVATPYTFDNPNWTEEERTEIKNIADLVISSGNDFSKPPLEKVEHEGFVVGYVGFLGYEKTNPRFVQICEKCEDIPGIKFVIVGDTSKGEELVSDVEKSKIRDKVIFRGYKKNIYEELAKFDVFACLLQEEHTGASENALLEAMYAKVCPVVFKQCTEQYLVKDHETGIVCSGEEAFVNAIRMLYKDVEKREKLGKNASRYVAETLSIHHTVTQMQKVYEKVMQNEKKKHVAANIFGKTPYEWFKTCYEGDLNNLKGMARGESKGSVKQFYKYFKDENLKKIIEVNRL